MAQKTICDVCGRDITLRDTETFKFRKVHLHVLVEIEKDGWVTADICLYCLADAFASRDDRPKEGKG